MGEQKDISDERNLVHLINDHLRQLAPHVMGRESAKLLGEAARELAAAKERIADLETRLKESQELSDVSVPLCHEHEAKIAELERRLTDAEAMVEQVWIDKGIAALQDKLQVAWDKTAELETRLACARAEAIEQCAAECDGSTKAGMYIASDIRALAAAPQGYVCVKAEADTITLQNMIGQWYLDDMSPPLARMRGVYKVLAAARKP